MRSTVLLLVPVLGWSLHTHEHSFLRNDGVEKVEHNVFLRASRSDETTALMVGSFGSTSSESISYIALVASYVASKVHNWQSFLASSKEMLSTKSLHTILSNREDTRLFFSVITWSGIVFFSIFFLVGLFLWQQYVRVGRTRMNQRDVQGDILTEVMPSDLFRTCMAHQKGVEWLHEIFENTAKQYPNSLCLRVADAPSKSNITFAQMDQRAELIRKLVERVMLLQSAEIARRTIPRTNVDPVTASVTFVVGILLDRVAVEPFACQLGVLKSGAACLMLDHSVPDSTLQYMCEDSQVSCILCGGAYCSVDLVKQRLPGFKAPILDVVEFLKEVIFENTCANEWIVPRLPLGEALDADRNRFLKECKQRIISKRPEDRIAMVIYTSGSTGKPKAVISAHTAYVNSISFDADRWSLQKDLDVSGQATSLSFDASLDEIYIPWAHGCPIVLLSNDHVRSGPDLVPIIHKEGITMMSPVPSLLPTLSAHPDQEFPLPLMRYLYVGGEALPKDLIKPWTQGGRRLVNGYGPTEAAICCLSYEQTADDPDVMIGTPFANSSVFIMPFPAQDEDEDTFVRGLCLTSERPLPFGETGELCVSGKQLAKGYLNQPEMTKRKFIEHPTLGRYYRTGDLCTIDPVKREVKCLGRIDHQVKIRGHRVELQAVENGVMQCIDDLKNTSKAEKLDQKFECLLDVTLAVASKQEDQLVVFLVAENMFNTCGTPGSVPSQIASSIQAPSTHNAPSAQSPNAPSTMSTPRIELLPDTNQQLKVGHSSFTREFKTILKKYLHHAAVPTYVIFVDDLQRLSSSRKIDRKKLPDIRRIDMRKAGGASSPLTMMMEPAEGIMEEDLDPKDAALLQVVQSEIRDATWTADFVYDHGLDSIMIARLTRVLRSHGLTSISVRELLTESRTPQKLAQWMRNKGVMLNEDSLTGSRSASNEIGKSVGPSIANTTSFDRPTTADRSGDSDSRHGDSDADSRQGSSSVKTRSAGGKLNANSISDKGNSDKVISNTSEADEKASGHGQTSEERTPPDGRKSTTLPGFFPSVSKSMGAELFTMCQSIILGLEVFWLCLHLALPVYIPMRLGVSYSNPLVFVAIVIIEFIVVTFEFLVLHYVLGIIAPVSDSSSYKHQPGSMIVGRDGKVRSEPLLVFEKFSCLHLRLWVRENLDRSWLTYWDWLNPTHNQVVTRWILSLYGATVGRDVIFDLPLNASFRGEISRLTIGEGSVVALSFFHTSNYRRNEISVGAITIGNDVKLGIESYVGPATVIQDAAELTPLSAVATSENPHSTTIIGAGQIWEGVPARNSGRARKILSQNKERVANDEYPFLCNSMDLAITMLMQTYLIVVYSFFIVGVQALIDPTQTKNIGNVLLPTSFIPGMIPDSYRVFAATCLTFYLLVFVLAFAFAVLHTFEMFSYCFICRCVLPRLTPCSYPIHTFAGRALHYKKLLFDNLNSGMFMQVRKPYFMQLGGIVFENAIQTNGDVDIHSAQEENEVVGQTNQNCRKDEQFLFSCACNELAYPSNLMPDVTQVGTNTFWAEGCHIDQVMHERVEANGKKIMKIQLLRLRLPQNYFIGNGAVIHGFNHATNKLVGVKTYDMGGSGRRMFSRLDNSQTIFGKPPLKIGSMRNSAPSVDPEERKEDFEPGFNRFMWRYLLMDGLLDLVGMLPNAFLIGFFAFAYSDHIYSIMPSASAVGSNGDGFGNSRGISNNIRRSFLALTIIFLVVWFLAHIVNFFTFVSLKRVLLTGGKGPRGALSMWHSQITSHFFLMSIGVTFVHPLLNFLEGTLIANYFYRKLGVVVGHNSLIVKMLQSWDHDNFVVGDDCIINAATLQIHTFEDRLFWSDLTTLHNGVVLHPQSCVMGGSSIGANAEITPGSVVMKTEFLTGGKIYQGSPVEERPSSKSDGTDDKRTMVT